MGIDVSWVFMLFIAFQNSFWEEWPNFWKNLALLSLRRATTLFLAALYFLHFFADRNSLFLLLMSCTTPFVIHGRLRFAMRLKEGIHNE